ncbi:MAG: hypothetical protein LBI45_09535 [Bacteroidales bacterium]|nr:hypothetical protein [Bacteroidales bacterium]
MKNLSLITVICCLFVLFIGCKKEFNLLTEQGTSDPPNRSGLNNEDGLQANGEPYEEIILGNQLVNAYSVANMTMAYDSLLNSRSNLFSQSSFVQNLTISATHLYVCFKPQDSTEYNYLIDESGLTLFHYPLDYEIIQQGLYYIRPGSQYGDLPWLYTTIPVGQANSIIVPYDVLEKCFIPDELVLSDKHNASALTETMAMLELEALMQTRNITQEEYEEAIFVSRGAKNPSGYIKVKNTSTQNLEGVRKVKVRVHNIIKLCEATTDENGYYKMSKSYLTNVHYATIFENSTGFKVWGNWAFLCPANYNMGWHSNSGHNRNIETNSDAWPWATVNNAAYIYREKICPNLNITKPASNLRIWFINKSNGMGAAPMTHRTPIQLAAFNILLGMFSINSYLSFIAFVLPDVFIICNVKDTEKFYSLVFHELSHASHYEKAGSGYWLNYISGIVANVNKNTYGDGTGALDGYIGVGEMWGEYFEWRCMTNITALGYSFTNVPTPGTTYWFKPKILYNLQLQCSLTPKQIYDCLTSDVTNHSQLKSKLISKYGNSASITAVFAAFGF